MKSLHERLNTSQLNEHAYSKDIFQSRSLDRLIQILENWCLIKYCHVYDPEHITLPHWKNELTNLIEIIQDMIISPVKNNKKIKRKRYLTEEWITLMEVNHRFVTRKTHKKLIEKEQLDINKVKTIITMFIEEDGLTKLIDICSEPNNTKNKSYINSI